MVLSPARALASRPRLEFQTNLNVTRSPDAVDVAVESPRASPEGVHATQETEAATPLKGVLRD